MSKKITKCYKCLHLEKIEGQKEWHYCPLKDLKIHWKWAVNPPDDFSEIKHCKLFADKETGTFKCFNDPGLYKNL